MANRFVFLFLSCACLHASAMEEECAQMSGAPSAEQSNHQTDSQSCRSYAGPMAEVKSGYFLFATSKMRDIFDGGFGVQGCGSYPVWRWLQIYGSVGFLKQSGKTSSGDATSIWELPVDVGLKPVFNLYRSVQYYFAIGPRYFYVHQHNDSPYVDRNIAKNGVGLFVNTGFNFYLFRGLFIDVFGEYSYQPIHFSPSKTNVYGKSSQVGGFLFGGGLGYSF